MRWCFDSGTHAYADAVLHHLESDEGEALVPVLWRYEVSAVLARAQLNGLLAPLEATAFLEDLEVLNIVVDPDMPGRILTTVHQLAVSYRLTSYDAAYLELALRRELPIATLDEELQRTCKQAGITLLE
jgi:predicted nucleic acid-binding protein